MYSYSSASDQRQPTQRQTTASQPTDDALITQIQAKHVTALHEIYRRYARLVHASALRILKSKEEAEDITQEIFLILWHQCRYDKSRGSLKNFLVMKTRSRAIDRLRSHQAHHRTAQKLSRTDSIATHTTTPIEQIEQNHRAQNVRRALLNLPYAEREVLRSTYYDNLSQIEIARRLNIPLGTVKSRCRQGLKKLRLALASR